MHNLLEATNKSFSSKNKNFQVGLAFYCQSSSYTFPSSYSLNLKVCHLSNIGNLESFFNTFLHFSNHDRHPLWYFSKLRSKEGNFTYFTSSPHRRTIACSSHIRLAHLIDVSPLKTPLRPGYGPNVNFLFSAYYHEVFA